MPKCRSCGEDIIFRHVDGEVKPIHIGGRGCFGGYSGGGNQRPAKPLKVLPLHGVVRMSEIAAYVNPNAKCPVCQKSVFYYQNEHGSRVFFNAPGWPWEKHPCTDTKDARGRPVYAVGPSVGQPSNTAMDGLAVCSVIAATWDKVDGGKSSRILLTLERQPRGLRERIASLFGTKHLMTLEVGRKDIDVASANLSDFLDAPSIVLPIEVAPGEIVTLSMISIRLMKMIQVSARLLIG